jgi:hypothetical protein
MKWRQEEAERQRDDARRKAERLPDVPSASGPRSLSGADCKARFDRWVAVMPRNAQVNRWDVDRAIGEGCSDLLVEEMRNPGRRR